MKGLMTTVTTAANGKNYFVPTVKSSRRKGLHETAVFANFWQPRVVFFGSDAAHLHARVTALVRDVDPADWNDKDWFISPRGR